MEGCTERTEIFGMVWKPVPSVPKRSVGYIPAEIPAVYLGTYRTEHTLGKLYSSFEYFESSMGSCTQALSILSRVWKVILDTRLIVEYLPATVLILE